MFSEIYDRVSAAYFPGFTEVCEEVYNGSCSHAILPVYNSRDGQLISFRRLILKYDLKISLVADVETYDESSMRFALLQKSIDLSRISDCDFLDLSIVLDNKNYASFLSSCEVLGANLLMLNSLPLDHFDDRNELSIQLDVSHASLDAFLYYLEGSHVRYDIVGLYSMIHT